MLAALLCNLEAAAPVILEQRGKDDKRRRLARPYFPTVDPEIYRGLREFLAQFEDAPQQQLEAIIERPATATPAVERRDIEQWLAQYEQTLQALEASAIQAERNAAAARHAQQLREFQARREALALKWLELREQLRRTLEAIADEDDAIMVLLLNQ